jgi:hypothetical protein
MKPLPAGFGHLNAFVQEATPEIRYRGIGALATGHEHRDWAGIFQDRQRRQFPGDREFGEGKLKPATSKTYCMCFKT